MRFYAYAGASTALATGVIIRALHERANFYSACVYVSQSNACLMILTNLLLLALGGVIYGLQQLLYGPLRPIEVEQLYEKAWFAITETCLAMTIFREEVGAWFIVMFVSLLIGKVWGWIGDGRVEILEQQPPANPRLFHARLSTSLALSFLFDVYLLNYSVATVRQQARPNMMVMFAFEFAVLAVTSMSTCARYGLSLQEAVVVKRQTSQRLQHRRQQIVQEREEARNQAEANGEELEQRPPVEEELDELDIDVPGWEEKGRWAFYLDLVTDFLKLILYLTFFCVLCIFYGMPIHIIRDVALTIRSFYNRITDFVKYRAATKDMNERYPDATAEDMGNEDVCIICRETMSPWQPPNPNTGPGSIGGMEERLRAKKLPCGHVLHFACLRSWLERQQKCPTCRADVVVPTPPTRTVQTQARAGAVPDAENVNQAQPAQNAPHRNNPGQNRVRFFNLGPLRFGFGAGNDAGALAEQIANQRPALRHQQQEPARAGGITQMLGLDFGAQRQQQPIEQDVTTQIQNIERQLMREMNVLTVQQEQLQVIYRLRGELALLRSRQDAISRGETEHVRRPTPAAHGRAPIPASPAMPGSFAMQTYTTPNNQQNWMGSGNPGLPQGVSIPEGWSLMVLPQQQHQTPAGSRPASNMSGLPNRMNGAANHNQTSFPASTTIQNTGSASSASGIGPHPAPTRPNESPIMPRRQGAPTTQPVSNNSTTASSSTNLSRSPESAGPSSSSLPSQSPPGSIGTPTRVSSDTQLDQKQAPRSQSDKPAERAVESQETVPRWGTATDSSSGAASTDQAQAQESYSLKTQALSPPDSQEPRMGKGKGRAPMVEDATDEGD